MLLSDFEKQEMKQVSCAGNLHEKLLRDKCADCKKLFLACRSNDSADSKTCDSCFGAKQISDAASRKFIKEIDQTPAEVVTQVLQPSILQACENSKLFGYEFKSKRCTKYCEETIKTIPFKLGTYSVHHKIVHDGYYLSIGDIVSIRSKEVEYFAQIAVFIENKFCEKYAALIWLVPTTMKTNSAFGFDPYSFTYGPQDESFYDVRHLKFVMHPPTRFYKRFIPTVPENKNLILGPKSKHKINCKRKI